MTTRTKASTSPRGQGQGLTSLVPGSKAAQSAARLIERTKFIEARFKVTQFWVTKKVKRSGQRSASGEETAIGAQQHQQLTTRSRTQPAVLGEFEIGFSIDSFLFSICFTRTTLL